MKFLSLFLVAILCMAAFIGQTQANKGGSNNIVVKDGHLIVSSRYKKGKYSDNIVIKDDNGGGHGCGCHQHWSSSWW